jgi:LCP family protein required for cell wall assembly
MNDLIRQAIAAEAEERVDSRTVLAELHKRRKSRKPIGLIIGVATLTAAAAAAAVIIPTTIKKTDAAPAVQPPASTAQNVLLMGTDDVGNTDAIVFARFEADGSAAVISLPRDIYVGSGADRINSLYQADPRRMTSAVEDLTGAKVDHYAAIKMSEFGAISNAVGGVEVCLNSAVKDINTGAGFVAGKQVLQGEQAVLFLRQRSNLVNGDLDRVKRQQAFLASLASKITKDNAATLARAVSGSIKVDAGFDVLEFAQRFQGPVKIRTTTLPVGEPVQRNGKSGFTPDPGQTKQFVDGYFGGKGAAETGCVD